MIFRADIIREDLYPAFVERLELAEKNCRTTFEITSGYREGDERCHGYRMAVDIKAHSGWVRFQIVKSLLEAGFKRIGVYDKHVHVDVCTDQQGFAQEVLWAGVSK